MATKKAKKQKKRPASAATVRHCRDIAAARRLGSGASVTVSVRVPPETADAIDRAAAGDGMGRTEWVRRVLSAQSAMALERQTRSWHCTRCEKERGENVPIGWGEPCPVCGTVFAWRKPWLGDRDR